MYINPVNEFYLRNSQQMNPQYNQGYQLQLPFPPQQPQVPQIHCSWVSSIEEARAAQMDFVATNLYVDTSTGKIFLKRMGDNGKPQFITYVIDNDLQEKDPLTEINARLTNIEKFISDLGATRNESVSSNADVRQSAELFDTAAARPNESNGTAESTGFSKNAANDKWQKRR